MKLKSIIVILSTAIIFTACGDGTSSQANNTANKAKQTLNQPTTAFNKRVVNNKGTSVEAKIDNYTVKIFSDEIVKANPKDRHKGVAIKINGEFKKTIPIEDAYTNKTIGCGFEYLGLYIG